MLSSVDNLREQLRSSQHQGRRPPQHPHHQHKNSAGVGAVARPSRQRRGKAQRSNAIRRPVRAQRHTRKVPAPTE